MVRKKTSAIDLRAIFRGLQDQMEVRLTFNRKIVAHPGAKGSATELEWASMLTTYLPRRYCADKGFVIDSTGRISDEIDIIIYDRQYSPFILHQNGVMYVPAECVYAVIEVKQTLSRLNLEYAQKKAASVRRLRRTSLPIPHAGGTYPAKKPARILAGIVALDGKMSAAQLKALENAAESKILNFGCSLLGRSYFSFPELHPWKANKRPYVSRHLADTDGLVRFFMNLVSDLQKVGTVVAIDANAYLK